MTETGTEPGAMPEAPEQASVNESPEAALARENETLACFAWQALLQDAKTSAALFRELARREPRNPDYWAALGLALAKNSQRREAILALERAVELRPKNIEAWCVLGELAMDEMEWKKAAAALRRCLELDPNAKNAHGLRARALIKKGEKLLTQG